MPIFIKKHLYIPIFIFFVVVTLRPSVDLDLGWHLRYGKYFFQTGSVLKDNILSFVWPNYQWVQASWGYDLLVYQIYTNFGFLGLSLAAAAITVSIFLVITYPINKFKPFTLLFLAAVFLVETLLSYSAGIRSQTPSTLFFAIALFISYTFRGLYFLPLLFLIWSNMHGGFALGLILLSIIWLSFGALLIFKKVKNVKQWAIFGLMLLLSFITPILNPWGISTYKESFEHTSNFNLTSINEWQPLTTWLQETIILGIISVITIAIVILSKRRITNIPYLVAFLITIYLALSAVRFTIIFGVMAVYLLAQNIPEINWGKYIHPKLGFSLKVFLIAAILADIFFFKKYLVVPDSKLLNFSWVSYCDIVWDCSEGITEVMLKDPPKGNGYHPYNYGGYLSWRVPQVKTFVDGRMAAWEKDGQTPPVILSHEVVTSETPIPFIKLDSEYHFQWVIVHTPASVTGYLDNLIKKGIWEKRYRDEFYTYYVKVKPK